MAEKISIISEKTYTYEGLYDIGLVYNGIKDFIEVSMSYHDLTETELEDKYTGNSREIITHLIAERIFSEEYKIFVKFKMELSGVKKEVEIEGFKKTLVDGKAKMVLNAYIQPHWHHAPPKGALGKFLSQVYSKYVHPDEIEHCIEASAIDVARILGRFKELVNMGIK